MNGQALVLRGDALHIPLPDNSVDLIITSPPYFALRSYRDEGEHYAGQIGSEPTPQAFLAALWAATREMKRVFKPTGSMWINLGDKYAGSGGHNNNGLGKSTLRGHGGAGTDRDQHASYRRDAPNSYNQNAGDIRPKSLMGLPWRYAIGCIDDLGLILRAEVVWSKPNGLPESVTDRVRRSHEQWFHFTKEPKYFAAVDEVREEHSPNSHAKRKDGGLTPYDSAQVEQGRAQYAGLGTTHLNPNPLGKLPGSVWSIPSEPLIIPEWAKEKEEVDWIGKFGLCRRCKKLRLAGSGQELEPQRGMEPSTSKVTEPSTPTDSPTNSGSALSQTDSSLTISAETGDASTLPTSKSSPLERTSDEDGTTTEISPTVREDILTTTQTLLDGVVGLCECVEPVETISDEHAGPGSVWSIPSEPLIIPQWAKDRHNLPDHFAAFPQEWPRRLILGWSPSGVCEACGEGRRPVVEKESELLHTQSRSRGPLALDNPERGALGAFGSGVDRPVTRDSVTITDYACACPEPTAPTKPAVVLDPFGGTGTVAMVARALGRDAISLDLSMDYSRLAQWRIHSSGHGAKALGRTWRERQGTL